MTVEAGPAVPDTATVLVPAGARVLVVSDLHLGARPDATSLAAAHDVAQALDGWVGAGALVLAGDVFELLAGPPDVGAALTAHPELRDAVGRFGRGRDDRTIVVLPGNHDARLAWDQRAAAAITRCWGSVVLALAVDLAIETGAGCRRVRVEHGHRLDPLNALADPRDPSDTPLGHHVVTELLPALPRRPWLDGIDALTEAPSLPTFVASRLAYRRIARPLAWVALPLIVVALLRAPVRWELSAAALGADLALVAMILALVARRAWHALADVVGARDRGANDAQRDEARRLVTEGWSGLVAGHTHQPELTRLGPGFFANSGCGTRVVEAAPARFGLPPVFLVERRLSWLELEAGADLHVRLLHASTALPGATLLERAVARRPPRATPPSRASRVSVVAAFTPSAGAATSSWAPIADPALRLRRVRRAAAAAIGLAGVLDLVSALTPPLSARLHLLVAVVPLAVAQAAAALAALAGLALLALARGVRRGQRHAWATAIAILAATVALHVVKGGDVEESLVALTLALWLLRHHGAFTARVDRPSLRRGLATVVGGAALSVVIAAAVIVAMGHAPLVVAIQAAAERLVGITSIPLHDRLDDFLTPTLGAAGFGLAAAVGWLAFRPVVRRHHDRDEIGRARGIVQRHGADTLAYFALRDDKAHFFAAETVVAYAVFGGVALVSPDPVGPAAERDEAWRAFRRFAGAQGWTVAVIGASDEWLPVYGASGMHDLYIGDEAIIDAATFRLDGGDRKPLRQAVNRVERAGYSVRFLTGREVTPALRAEVLDILDDSRRGDVERGFSMTLGRAVDPADEDVLLAVAFDPDGRAAAFCQYVPATGINGWSLDLMRRRATEQPNGVTDFVVVRTLDWMREHGYRGLGLNFATMRAVLAGEAGAGLAARVEQRVLQRLGDTMQIESLWRYNAKFGPAWFPRHAVYESPEHVLPVALAIARAESFWELPVIGRFLAPGARAGSCAAEAVAHAADGLDRVASERPVDLVP